MFVGNINIAPLLKAFRNFETFSSNSNTEQEKAGTVQAFRYCFELTWQAMKRLLAERGKVVNSPREAFRAAALEGFIDDPEIWFEFLKNRNLTVHTYQDDILNQVMSIIPQFSLELRTFLDRIGAAERW